MQNLIDKFNLIPHPEGGYYAVVYESKQSVKSPVVKKDRKAVTHIYFLLLEGQVSVFHKVVHDEIWNFYEGDPVKLIKYDGSKIKEGIIGSGCSDYVSIVEGGIFRLRCPLEPTVWLVVPLHPALNSMIFLSFAMNLKSKKDF